MVFPSLDTFSTELLLIIFKDLDVFDLCSLRMTCRRFNDIISTWVHEFGKNEQLLVTNQSHSIIRERSARILTIFERTRISRNWKSGFFKEKEFLKTRVKYLPWLQLEKELLWITRGEQIVAFKRNNEGIDSKSAAYTINFKNKADVSRFVKRDDLILSSNTNGNLLLWSTSLNKPIVEYTNYHQTDILTVDLRQNVFISASRDNHVKLAKIRNTDNWFLYELIVPERIWSIALTHNLSTFAVGSSGQSTREPIFVYDIETATLVSNIGRGTGGNGVLDMKWADSTNLWTCGYAGDLRHWDIRTGNCEHKFTDPYNDGMYCFEYDQCNTILSGCQTNGRVILWDMRLTNYVQMYFMESCRQRYRSSPVYSLSFDADYLFAATDQHLNILNFSVTKGKRKDYSSNIFRN